MNHSLRQIADGDKNEININKLKAPPAAAGLSLLLLLLFLYPLYRSGAAEKSANQEIYLYQGADRQQKLIENAKKEGSLVIYTTLNLVDSGPLTEIFEKKYGIKITLWRASSEKVLQRTVAEAKAGYFAPDVIETNGPEMEALYREQLLEEFHSPALKDIPAEALPKHKHYVPDRFNFYLLAYNTKLIKPEDVPNSYEDLLNPKWTGKLGLEAADVGWFTAVVKSMGEEKGLAYFRKLAAMKPQLRTGHSLIAEMVVSGETPITLDAYNHGVERLKKKGAPIEWRALQPAFGEASAVGVTTHAPHPHAGLLFVDLILSKEGQKLILDHGRVPSSRAVESPLNNFKYRLIDPAVALDEGEKWTKIWSDIFLGGKAPPKESQ